MRTSRHSNACLTNGVPAGSMEKQGQLGGFPIIPYGQAMAERYLMAECAALFRSTLSVNALGAGPLCDARTVGSSRLRQMSDEFARVDRQIGLAPHADRQLADRPLVDQ